MNMKPYSFDWNGAVRLLLVALCCSVCQAAAHAQVLSQTLLSPSDGWEFGNALAASGNTLVVGDQFWLRSPGRTTTGSAYVYTLAGGKWTQRARLTASDGRDDDLFGCSVAISGSTIVVGAMLHNGSGAAYVFTLNKGKWTQQQELTALDGKVGDSFGCCVAIAGTTIALGACHRSIGSAGAVYTYSLVSGHWGQQSEITHNPATTPGALFGFALALSGNALAIGAPGDDEGDGAAYVTTFSGGSWSPPTALALSTPPIDSQFGYSVAMLGNTLAVGAPGISAAYVFTQGGGNWSQQSVLGPIEGASITGFGTALTLAANTLVVSAVNDNDLATYVFTQTNSGWTPTIELTPAGLSQSYLPDTQFGAAVALIGSTVVVSRPLAVTVPTTSFLSVGTVHCFVLGGEEAPASDQQASALSGTSTALSGTALLSGAPGANGYMGAVFTYTLKAGKLTAASTLTAANGQSGDSFGTSLAFDGKTLAVGAPHANNGTGAIYILTYSTGKWKPVAELTASDGQSCDLFGNAIALSGATIAVGAPGRNTSTGAVYLFGLNGAVWTQQAELAGANGQVGDAFGTAVSIDAGRLLVGSPNADTYASVYTGAAYLYTLSSGKWQPTAEFDAADGQFGAQFGMAVGISGTNAAVGSPGGNDVPSAVYTYSQGAGGWLMRSELNDGWIQQDQFGSALALSGNTLLVGASAGNSLTGSAYLFNFSGGAWSLSSVLTALDGQQLDEFGASVALSATGVAIGAPNAAYGAGSFYGF